jgi:hypothetical protein
MMSLFGFFLPSNPHLFPVQPGRGNGETVTLPVRDMPITQLTHAKMMSGQQQAMPIITGWNAGKTF